MADILDQVQELVDGPSLNHKGRLCTISPGILQDVQGPLFCQEGYCEDCEVYRIWKENQNGRNSRKGLY